MARPVKVGCDYFPLDVNLDDKVKLVEFECGLVGFAIVIKLFQKIYECGYYYAFDNDAQLLFCKDNTVEKKFIEEVIDCCLRRNIFNNELFNKFSILTSTGIQKRYIKIKESTKCILINEEYLLLDDSDLPNNVQIVGVNSCLTEVNPLLMPQSKVKKSKENESKQNKSKENENNIVTVVVDFYEQNIGTISPTILSDINYYLKQGIEPALIILCIKKSVDNNKRNWSYAKGILKNLQANGVNTVKQYESEEVSKNGTTSIYSCRDKPTRKLSGVTYL